MGGRALPAWRRLAWPGGAGRRGARTKLAAAGGLALLVLPAALIAWLAPGGLGRARVASQTPGASPPAGAPLPPALAVRSAELWFATTPAPGVWAELKIVVDNPAALDATHTHLLVPGSLLDDFQIRSTEPRMVAPPRRLPDGAYVLVFPPPIDLSWNWYRVHLTSRVRSPRPVRVAISTYGGREARGTGHIVPQVLYVDREADPFLTVPEPLVRWVPGQARSVFPILVVYAVVLGSLALAGCAAAFLALRR